MQGVPQCPTCAVAIDQVRVRERRAAVDDDQLLGEALEGRHQQLGGVRAGAAGIAKTGNHPKPRARAERDCLTLQLGGGDAVRAVHVGQGPRVVDAQQRRHRAARAVGVHEHGPAIPCRRPGERGGESGCPAAGSDARDTDAQRRHVQPAAGSAAGVDAWVPLAIAVSICSACCSVYVSPRGTWTPEDCTATRSIPETERSTQNPS